MPVIGKVSLSPSFGFKDSVERSAYLLLILYSSWQLGTNFGVATWLASALAMLPHILTISTSPRTAATESVAALIIGGLSISLIQMRRGWYQQQKRLLGIKAALKASQENYEELFTNASDAIWVHDMDGKITVANKACEKVSGYPPHELIGKNVSEFLLPEALDMARELKAKLMKGETMEQRYDQRLVKKNGSVAIVELFTRLIRTDDKPIGFQNIARDVTEERTLRDNLRLQIHETLKAQEEERKRIARELHDDVAQSILYLSRRLDILLSGSSLKLPKALLAELEQLQSLATDIYKALQRFARDLRPSILDQMGLVAALNWLAEELTKDLGIQARVKAEVLPSLPSTAELALFRIAQEALNNIRKHAQASVVDIMVEVKPSHIRMEITDNGKGFSLSKLTSDLVKEGKLGVLGMEERARLIGGSLRISSEPGKGTTVIVEAPISR